MYFLNRRFRATVVCTLYVNYSSPVSVKSCLAPRTSGASPADLPVPGAPIEPEPVPPHVDAHLSLLAEAVGSERVNTGADQTNCNKL